MKTKRIPVRMCVACREGKPKRDMMRIVADNGALTVDPTGKMQGRGAYLCYDGECLKRAKKTRALERSLGAPMTDEFCQSVTRAILRRDIERAP